MSASHSSSTKKRKVAALADDGAVLSLDAVVMLEEDEDKKTAEQEDSESVYVLQYLDGTLATEPLSGAGPHLLELGGKQVEVCVLSAKAP